MVGTARVVSVCSCSFLLLVVAFMKISFRCVKAYKDDSLRWWGVLLFSASAKFEAADMTASSGMMVGFVIYLCL